MGDDHRRHPGTGCCAGAAFVVAADHPAAPMNGTVQFNTAETVWWFGLFPILTAFAIAFLLLAGRAVLRRVDARFQQRIDTALAYPLTFDEPDPEDDWMLIADVCQNVRNGWAA